MIDTVPLAITIALNITHPHLRDGFYLKATDTTSKSGCRFEGETREGES